MPKKTHIPRLRHDLENKLEVDVILQKFTKKYVERVIQTNTDNIDKLLETASYAFAPQPIPKGFSSGLSAIKNGAHFVYYLLINRRTKEVEACEQLDEKEYKKEALK